MGKSIEPHFEITKEMQIKELVNRVTPILNVDIVVFRRDKKTGKTQFLIGHKDANNLTQNKKLPRRWLFPGGRMKFTESPQETAFRILDTEVPGVKAILKKLATALSDKGSDHRANGVTLYYLFEYTSGEPKSNSKLSDFFWGSSEDLKEKEGVYSHDISVLKELEACVRTMNTSEDELIIEVDKNNKEIGDIIKRVAHSDKSRYHRAAHLMIFNTKGEVILHQRSLNKSHGAGLWDMFGGHQSAGLTIEQTAYQELMEELGIHAELKLHKVWLFQAESQSEFCHVYYGISDGPYGYDRNEVEQINSFNCEKLLKGDYDKDYKFVHPFAKQYTKELSKVWKKIIENKSN